MESGSSFIIRRADDRWYAGQDGCGTPEWTDDIQSAALFTGYIDALRVSQQLEQAGFDVKLIEVL